ncbi:hypothetical protein HMPREF1219_00892 [Corynebacterium pyruviciproducens ATCC BAA-1742]|uniref:Uncharacterized protein n=1 Tax=Corynebacterium pyruviciproducens ATCC BAA-1742 TaxID=1125779 RepID=S2ZIP3_9CORY|nr:YceD family protein [Corynebacterium pyruviciproducens]EPD69947.1 hypothetical protein HMPREF1219_00892 [Corynebacterium pyruviciproducens ATCC BAA-1742]
MTNPLIVDCTRFMRGVTDPEHVTVTGSSPDHIGLEMMAINKGDDITLDVDLLPLGEGIHAHGTVTGVAHAQCSRCLTEHSVDVSIAVDQIYALTDTFITSHDEDDDEESDEDEVPRVENNMMDLTQVVIDEAGTTFPFNPTCESLTGTPCPEDSDVPESQDPENLIDPRWAGLEKFK